MLEPLIEKGEILPQSGSRTFRAARTLTPGSDDWIDVELFEQAPGVPEPEANLLIGAFRLSGRDLPVHARAVMPGDEVVLHWSVDDNQLIRASVELPGCALHLQDHSFYADDLAHIDFGTDGRQFASEALLAVGVDLDQLRANAGSIFTREIDTLQAQLTDQVNRLRGAYEADTFRSITEEARMLRQEVSRLRHKPRARTLEIEVALHELEQRRRRASGMLDFSGAEEIDGHLATAHTALAEGRHSVCERAMEAAELVIARTVVALPGYFTHHFMRLRDQRHAAVDKARFDQLIALGNTAMAAGDESRLRQVVSDMDNLLVRAGGQTTDAAAQAGLRR